MSFSVSSFLAENFAILRSMDKNMNREDIIMQILIVEDNPTDLLLAEEALVSTGLKLKIHVARDGVEAVQYLSESNTQPGVFKPHMIILDLNLPRKNGWEVLSELKSNELWKAIPIVVRSNSDAPNDIARAYELHANCYMVKEGSFERSANAFGLLISFWKEYAVLPARA